jgi:hypothetical protein
MVKRMKEETDIMKGIKIIAAMPFGNPTLRYFSIMRIQVWIRIW